MKFRFEIWRTRALVFLATALTACSGLPDRETSILNIAARGQFTRQVVSSGLFSLTTFRKQADANHDLLVVYIEGDGFAFQRRGLLSSDPTPRSIVALDLAAKDPHPAVMYVARPCQYLPDDALRTCDSKYWSTHRYSEDVIVAIDGAIDRAALGYKRIALVGYSGGGAVAALIAARRQNVAWLVTIAANLDHKLWTTLHQVTPLSGSLNAADYAVSIQNLPQLHLTGGEDKIVPFEVTKAFLSRMTNHSHVMVRTFPTYDHECCWARDWPKPACAPGDYVAYCGD